MLYYKKIILLLRHRAGIENTDRKSDNKHIQSQRLNTFSVSCLGISSFKVSHSAPLC